MSTTAMLIALALLPAMGLAGPPKPSLKAGDPIFYTDRPNDAYRILLAENVLSEQDVALRGPVEDPEKSKPAFDILRVDWGPVSTNKGRRSGGYSTSITLAAGALESGSYVSWGEFPSNELGEKCQLYHLLTPGTTAVGNAFCGLKETGTREFVGGVSGGPVTVTMKSSGESVVSATFDNRKIPELLEASDRTLNNVSAFTCESGDEGRGCRPYEVLDSASSSSSYRI